MATQEEAERKAKEQREAEEKNPLLKLGLGDLEREKDRLVFKLKEYAFSDGYSVPAGLRSEYARYQSIITELNRRGEEYMRYKPEPRFG